MSRLPISSLAEVNPPLPRFVAGDELVSFVRMQDVREGGGLCFTSDRQFRSVRNGFTRFADNDVLFAKITPCMENGKGALCRGLTNAIGCGSTEFHVLRAREGHAPGFIYHLLQSQSVRQKAETRMSGSAGQQRVQADFFDTHCVWIPEPTEQRRIAEILSTVDEAIEQTEALIAKYQQIKAGLMHDLFTRGLSAEASAKGDVTWKLRPTHKQAPHLYKESPLGWIPKEWEAKRLGVILKECGGYLQTGPFGSQLHAHEYEHEGVPVVMPQDINDGVISIDQIARIVERKAEELSRHRMRVGDIVIARRGELSRAAAIDDSHEGWLCGTGCFLLRLGRNTLHSDFAACVYRHDLIQRQIAGVAVGTTMPSLNNTVMERLFFPLCDPEEQLRITERLDNLDQLLGFTQGRVVKLRQQKHGLMQDLLTGRVRVKVAEPASR